MDAFPPRNDTGATPPVCAAGNGRIHTAPPACTGVKAFNQTPIRLPHFPPHRKGREPCGCPALPESERAPTPHPRPGPRSESRLQPPQGGAHPPPDEVATRLKTTQPSHPPREHILQRDPRSPAPGGPPVPFLPPWQRRRHPKPVFVTRPVHNTPPSIPRTREPYDESGPPTRGTCTQEREATNI